MPKQPEKTCVEDSHHAETRKRVQVFNRRFSACIILAVIYGFIFVNYIDVMSGGYQGYHLWLVVMYFFPFIILTVIYPRNWQLTIGLGIIVSLMNDGFYGVMRNILGKPDDLNRYYHLWLIPNGTFLFNLNLGFASVPVYSWEMALSIYARIGLTVFLLWSWRQQAKIKCIDETQT